jgi:hypothetical protein
MHTGGNRFAIENKMALNPSYPNPHDDNLSWSGIMQKENLMTKGYVFKAGRQMAISKESDGSNLPSPKVSSWEPIKTVDDVNQPGLIGFDPEPFAKQGYQVWPSNGGVLADKDILSNQDILKK